MTTPDVIASMRSTRNAYVVMAAIIVAVVAIDHRWLDLVLICLMLLRCVVGAIEVHRKVESARVITFTDTKVEVGGLRTRDVQ